ASVGPDISQAEIEAMDAAGVRGVRFNFVKRLVDRVPTDSLEEIVAKIAPLGWHVVIYFEAEDLPELYDFFSAIPTDVVVDHMGRPDVTKDPDGPEFGLFLRFMRENPNVWTKVSCPERLSVSGPKVLDGEQHAYTDVVPFARRVVEEFPDRVLWGTDWPHPNLKDHMPDDGLLVDYIPQIATTAELQQRLLVDNPTRLYWPEGV
ncbi:MAG: amidohydrolase family protein, partial [Leucobacter sp.]|nr:amidohydrolase family protein [Leucobacter sp.]